MKKNTNTFELKVLTSLFILLMNAFVLNAQNNKIGVIRGTIVDEKDQPVDYAQIYLENSQKGAVSDQNGQFYIKTSPGKYTLCIQMTGYKLYRKEIQVNSNDKVIVHAKITPTVNELKEIQVNSKSTIERVKESAYNVVAVDASKLQNSNVDLAHALTNVSGIRIRETGGVGSDVNLSLNGFSGRHVKIFIDGVPMQGMGSSFGLNNIPINMADRIEVYKGVVPVGLGTDALGGAINVITNKRKRTYADISYSYGSFNTHKTSINAGITTAKGFNVEVNAFQNYSDNNYTIYNGVKDLESGSWDPDNLVKIKRFHDQYHNETAILKVGFIDKPFADRVYISLNAGKTYKQIQNGVIQDVVFGQKFTRGSSIMPSLLYQKRDIFIKKMNLNLTANYNYNITQNVDTATFMYNWYGEKKYTGKLGEQSYQDSKYGNNNWNSTLTLTYQLNDVHSFILNDVFTSFSRNTISIGQDATTITASDTMPKFSNKNVLGLSYKAAPSKYWNISVFGKQFHQTVKGPELESSSSTTYQIVSKNFDTQGYGAAGTIFLSDLQIKLSYEKALRLPSDNELFGDEDMEHSSVGLKPESSNNFNVNLNYSHVFAKKHSVFIDGGFIYRDVKDYIQRVIEARSDRYYGTYVNFGKVRNWGVNAEARYNFKDLFSAGMNLTYQDIRNIEESEQTSSVNTSYGARIPNTPFFFTTGDASLHFKNVLYKGNDLTIGYYNNYVYKFPRYSEANGSADTKQWIPTQFSQDASLTYTMHNGRYNVSMECRDITNAKLYDNFSLQKPGRSFSVKARYFFNK